MLNFNKYLLIILFFSFNTYASKLDNGYKALRIYDYFKAKKIFEKYLKKDSLGASFGLSIIYYREDNPFYNIDTAYKFITITEDKFNSLEEKKDTLFYEDISGFFDKSVYKTKIYKDTIINLKNKIIDKIYKTTEPKKYDDFIDKYFDYYKIDVVISLRDSLEFNIAKKNNTYESYSYYYEIYPNSRFSEEAKKKAKNRIFIENTSKNTLEEYEKFIKDFPNNPNVDNALDKIYELSIKNKTLKEFQNFCREI